MKENFNLILKDDLNTIDTSISDLEYRIELLENDIYIAKLDLGVFALKVMIQETIYNSTENQ